MRIRIGCKMSLQLPQATPMIVMVNVHHTRADDLETRDFLVTEPQVPVGMHRDHAGNELYRLVAPAGLFGMSIDRIIRDPGEPDPIEPNAVQHAVQDLPFETLQFLLSSRYCEADLLSEEAWRLFSATPPGWARVQAICDFVHDHITFGYKHASTTLTAAQVYAEGRGVCRDYTHLAIAFCRGMNIPARYCTGYLGDAGELPPYPPGDFAAWMEVYLSGKWWTFDPRNKKRRTGRVLIASGRDATDVPIVHTFGAHKLLDFKVWADEVPV